MFAVRDELEFEDGNMAFELEVERGNLTVQVKYIGEINLTSEQVQYAVYVLKLYIMELLNIYRE